MANRVYTIVLPTPPGCYGSSLHAMSGGYILISCESGDEASIYEDQIVALRAALKNLYYCGECGSWFQTDGIEPVICPVCETNYDATE